jgi:hypothetical protein
MGTIKLVVGVAVIVALFYGAWLLIPPYFANYQFEDQIKNTAMGGTYSTKSDDELREIVLKDAKDLEIPVTKNQIRVSRIGTNATGLAIDVDYSVHVDLPGFPVDLHFHPSTQNKSIM